MPPPPLQKKRKGEKGEGTKEKEKKSKIRGGGDVRGGGAVSEVLPLQKGGGKSFSHAGGGGGWVGCADKKCWVVFCGSFCHTEGGCKVSIKGGG